MFLAKQNGKLKKEGTAIDINKNNTVHKIII